MHLLMQLNVLGQGIPTFYIGTLIEIRLGCGDRGAGKGTVYGCYVSNLERFGVVDFAKQGGRAGRAAVGRGFAWLDTGTVDTLVDAAD